MYNVGDKFIIEIDSHMTSEKGNLYGIKGFKSLVFDDFGLEQLEKVTESDQIHVFDIVRIKSDHYKEREKAIVIGVNNNCNAIVLHRDLIEHTIYDMSSLEFISHYDGTIPLKNLLKY